MENSRYIVVEGPIGVGKTLLAEKIADSLGARLILEKNEENPFLPHFNRDKNRHAFQAQLFFLLARFRQLKDLNQLDLFQRVTVGDCLFDRDRLFATLNLDENECAMYDQIFNILRERVPQPDLVVYLSARTEVLWRRFKESRRRDDSMDFDYFKDVNEAYNRFFYHFDRAPLLVVNTSDVDFLNDEENFGHLLNEVKTHQKGVKHYIPLLTGSVPGKE